MEKLSELNSFQASKNDAFYHLIDQMKLFHGYRCDLQGIYAPLKMEGRLKSRQPI